MFLVKVKDALQKGEADITKALAAIEKDAPAAEAGLEATVAVLLPAEAGALNTLITTANTLVAAFSTANSNAVAAGSALGSNPQADAAFATSVKTLVADFDAALKTIAASKK
jgi:hypothetical protein